MLVEAKTQEDPLLLDPKGKKLLKYYFFSVNGEDDDPPVMSLAAAVGGNQTSSVPAIAVLNSGELVISYDHYANDHSPVLKGISVSKYKTDFTLIATYDIVPDQKLLDKASAYQTTKEKGLEYLETRQILPLDGGNFLLIAEYRIVQIVRQGYRCGKYCFTAALPGCFQVERPVKLNGL